MMDNAIYVAFFLRAVGQDLDAILGYEESMLVLCGGLPVLGGDGQPLCLLTRHFQVPALIMGSMVKVMPASRVKWLRFLK